jgi:hypothetical protein
MSYGWEEGGCVRANTLKGQVHKRPKLFDYRYGIDKANKISTRNGLRIS